MSDITTEVVQPEAPAEVAAPEGQGTSGLYNLEQIPEAIRPQVEPIFKEWDANVTKQFQERAEQIGAWKPYDELGIRDYAPDDLKGLLGFAEMAADDEQFKAWVKSTHDSLFSEQPPPAETPAAQDAATPTGPLSMDDVTRLLDEREQAAAAERQTQEAQAAAVAEIQTTLGKIRVEHGDNYGLPEVKDTKVEDLILHHALRYPPTEPDPIGKAHAELMGLIGGAERKIFSEKVAEKPAPETGGRADATPPKPPSSFEAATAAAKAHLQQAHA